MVLEHPPWDLDGPHPQLLVQNQVLKRMPATRQDAVSCPTIFLEKSIPNTQGILLKHIISETLVTPCPLVSIWESLGHLFFKPPEG